MGAFATLLSVFFIGLFIYFVVKEPSRGGKGTYSSYEHTLQYKEDTNDGTKKINKENYGADGRPLAGTPEFDAMIVDMAKKSWTKF